MEGWKEEGGGLVVLLLAERARSEGETQGRESFLCSRSARPPKGLARRSQSKSPHALAWLALKWESTTNGRAQWKINQSPSLKRESHQAWKDHL